MSLTEDRCPDCGDEITWDEVDIGVGVQRGNPRCDGCGWGPKPDPALEVFKSDLADLKKEFNQ